MAQQQPSMILSMLKTPQQVRQEQLAKLREKSLAQASLLAQPVAGAQTALPGLLRNYAAGIAAEIPTDIAQATRGITRGVGGMLGAAGYLDAGKAIAGATVTPEERLAATRQQILKGVNTADSTQLLEAANQLSSAGDTVGASALTTRAQELEKTAAETGLTRAKINTEIATAARQMAAAGLDQQKIVRELATLQPDLDSKAALTAANVALAEQRQEKTKEISSLLEGKIQMQTVDLALKAAQEGKTKQEIITLIEERQPNIDQTIAQTAAAYATGELATTRKEVLEAKLPGELLLQQAQLLGIETKTDLDRTNIAVNRQKLATIGLTDFQKELKSLVDRNEMTQERADELLTERLETKARTGGVAGIGNEVVQMKLGQFAEVIKNGEGTGRSIQLIGDVLRVFPDATVGTFGGTLAFAAEIGTVLGVPGAAKIDFANELLGYLSNRTSLEEASNLKGALSDKDLDFLKRNAPSGEMRPMMLKKLLTDLYLDRYARQQTAFVFDEKLSKLGDKDFRSYSTKQEEAKHLEFFRGEAQRKLNQGIF